MSDAKKMLVERIKLAMAAIPGPEQPFTRDQTEYMVTRLSMELVAHAATMDVHPTEFVALARENALAARECDCVMLAAAFEMAAQATAEMLKGWAQRGAAPTAPPPSGTMN